MVIRDEKREKLQLCARRDELEAQIMQHYDALKYKELSLINYKIECIDTRLAGNMRDERIDTVPHKIHFYYDN